MFKEPTLATNQRNIIESSVAKHFGEAEMVGSWDKKDWQ
jgi:hypothetical protein